MKEFVSTVPQDRLEETIFSCPKCKAIRHASMFVSYEPEYQRMFHCEKCGHIFYAATWGKDWGK
jgi:transcription elongation factor Elf1